MKNYPFSKKTIQALLAASIAFTPLVTTGVMAPQEVNAATQTQYSSVDQLVERFEAIYDTLSDDDKDVLLDARVALDAMTQKEWEDILDDVVVNNDSVDLGDKVAVAKAIANVIYSATSEELSNNVEAFQAEYTNSKVQEVFGSTVTSTSLLNYIAEVELQLFDLLSDEDVVSLSSTEFYLILLEALLLAKNYGFEEEYNALTSTIDAPSIFTIKDELQTKIDPSGAVKTVLLNAFTNLDAPTRPGTGGGDIGGGGYTPAPTTPTEVVKEEDQVITKLPKEKVAEVVNQITTQNSVVSFVLEEVAAGETAKAQVPAGLFSEAFKKNKNASVEVSTKDGSYKLPVNQIDVAKLAKDLGLSNADDLEISISVNVVDESVTKDTVAKNNLKLASKVLEFKVTASSVDGKDTQEISRFTQYVERDIVSSTAFKSTSSVAVKLNDNGTFSAVPTLFDGKTATVKSLTNSKYVIVENEKTFTDVDGGKNWAETHIEKLASKYIINGKTETSYDPSADITRGEFAALISRSLGLVATDAAAVTFDDVSSNQAINKNGEIAAAVEAGIIKGREDGKFYPGNKITRADAAIMISRAMTYVNADLSGLNNKKLTDLTDYTKVGASSKEAVEAVMQADIMSGFSNGSFGPEATTKRDQMAKILDKFLQFVKFVN
ncbi:S-layer homology domain-containing protein [Cytobacillus sp. S13-E01]|uniref:S-layer homology domain-containing protein n=1 Tax=Cytobacillus sp. S13-E01 TaxID=3031326 RepID=UPI0023D896F5|nr:S-layer homology domain-containing protein [Cytobacillus sp. S13-E01]MDF0726039.1 S-layer homology domain-containing protein [Cytobacillus sp. S13-E01]